MQAVSRSNCQSDLVREDIMIMMHYDEQSMRCEAFHKTTCTQSSAGCIDDPGRLRNPLPEHQTCRSHFCKSLRTLLHSPK